jgi:hypothetical protein
MKESVLMKLAEILDDADVGRLLSDRQSPEYIAGYLKGFVDVRFGRLYAGGVCVHPYLVFIPLAGPTAAAAGYRHGWTEGLSSLNGQN